MDARALRQLDVLRRRTLTQAGNRVAVAVTAGATSAAITFAQSEPDASYGACATPSWSTTAYVPVADKSAAGLTVRFGTAAPVGGGVVDVITFRSE